MDQDSQRIKTEPVRKTGSSENRRDCEMHFKPPVLLLGTLGLFFLMPLVVDAAHEKGLILRLGSPDGSSDARVARSVALHVPSGQSPSPFLKAGSFTARWEGKLVLEKRSRLVFHLEGRGQAKLLIDGEVLVRPLVLPANQSAYGVESMSFSLSIFLHRREKRLSSYGGRGVILEKNRCRPTSSGMTRKIRSCKGNPPSGVAGCWWRKSVVDPVMIPERKR